MAQQFAFTQRGKYILGPLAILAWVDCMLVFILYMVLGGNADTMSGAYIQDGHYFLHHKTAPHFVEVTQAVWEFSHYQLLSVIALYGLTALTAIVFTFTGDMTPKRSA